MGVLTNKTRPDITSVRCARCGEPLKDHTLFRPCLLEPGDGHKRIAEELPAPRKEPGK